MLLLLLKKRLLGQQGKGKRPNKATTSLATTEENEPDSIKFLHVYYYQVIK